MDGALSLTLLLEISLIINQLFYVYKVMFFDTLPLTGYEQLTLYARIKGLDEKIIHDTVSAFIEMLDLTPYAYRPVAGYL